MAQTAPARHLQDVVVFGPLVLSAVLLIWSLKAGRHVS